MKLITCGTSCGFPKKNRFTSCEFLLAGDSLYVIDAGAPVADLIVRTPMPAKRLRAVFITHPHGDHIGSLPAFVDLLNGYYTLGDVQFFLPNQACVDYAKFLTQTVHGERINDTFRFSVYGDGVIYQDENITVSAVPNEHCENSYSLIFQAEGKTLLLSGDLRKDYQDLPACATDGSVDFILLECAHQSYQTVKERLPALRAKQIKLNHLGRQIPEEALSDLLTPLAPALACPVSLSEDGEVIEI